MISQATKFETDFGIVIRDLVRCKDGFYHYRVRLAGTSRWFKDVDALKAGI